MWEAQNTKHKLGKNVDAWRAQSTKQKHEKIQMHEEHKHNELKKTFITLYFSQSLLSIGRWWHKIAN